MPIWVAPILIATGVVAFVLCVGGGLAILFEVWTPRHPATRKWLVGGVLASLVAAVGGFAATQFDSGLPDPATEHSADDAGTTPPPPVAKDTKQGDGVASIDEPGPLSEPVEREDEFPAKPQWSEPVAQWAIANLPPRPMLPIPLDKDYPACVMALRVKDIADVTRTEAKSCFRALQTFNMTVMLPYQNAQPLYTERVDILAMNQPDSDILTFLQSEYFSFTDPEGADFTRFNRIGNRFETDRKWLARLK